MGEIAEINRYSRVVQPDEDLPYAGLRGGGLYGIDNVSAEDGRVEGTLVNARIFVVDDDPTASALVAGIVEAQGYAVERFASAGAFLERADASLRGCLVLDLQMEGMTGLELQAELLQRGVRLPVIIVSGHAAVSSAVQAMKQQAFDFFEKPVDSKALAEAVRRAVDLDLQQSARDVESAKVQEHFRTLSPREKQVMELVVAGLANKQVAAKLGLSEKTIEVHRGNVMRKMQVESLPALVRSALVCGMTPPT